MQNYSLNLLIATTVFGCLILFGLINLLFSLRKRFSIRVNCWFCNTNLRVPYKDWNSFYCPKCEQYNGFSEDGDYNKEISAQFSSKFNNTSYCQRTNQDERMRLPAVNGFCEFCNRNQEIKVIQLANFKPRNELTYDQEIEEFKQKLDDSYQLCQQCQRHLNRTLNRVKTKFIGSKITQLRAKDKYTAKIISDDDGKYLSTLMMTSILLLSIANFMRDMKIEIPSFDFTIFNHIRALIFTFGDIMMSSIEDFNWNINELLEEVNVDQIAASALTLNSLLILNDRKNIKVQFYFSMILWAVKMITNEIYIHSSYIMAVNGMIAVSLIISSLCMFKKSKKEKLDDTKNGSFHKIPTEYIEDSDTELELSDPCSSSVFDIQSTSNRSAIYSQASKINSTQRSFYDAPEKSLNSTIRNATVTDLLSNKSFSITKEVMAADRKQIQNDITRLKINDNREQAALSTSSTFADFNTSQCSNPFSIERMSRRGSPTPSVFSSFSVSTRNNLISPPRLHSPQVYTSEVTPSWIAGGYWQSPQKKYLNSLQNQATMKPMMSRSSSQSSGLGTIEGSEKNSRENSISQEDAASLFSDATSNRRNFFEKPSSRTLFSDSQFFNQPKTHNNLFNSTFGGSNGGSFRKYRESNTFFK